MLRLLLPGITAVLVLGGGKSLRAEDPQAIVDKAIQAHGGAARIDKFRAGETHTQGIIYKDDANRPFTQVIAYQFPNQVRETIEIAIKDQKATVTTVFNGAKGWVKFAGETKEFNDKFLTEMKESENLARVTRLTPLRDGTFTLSVVGNYRVGGRPAVALRVATRGFRDITLYFDRTSGLLLQTQRQAMDPMNGVDFTEDRVITLYQDIDGIQTPRKVMMYRNDKKFMDVEVTDVKFLDRLDDNLFAKP